MLQHDLSSTSLESTTSDNSSVSASVKSLQESSDSSEAWTRTHAANEAAKEMVRDALQAKPGGQTILNEHDQKETLTDGTRRNLVNLLVANKVENHGREAKLRSAKKGFVSA